MAKRKSSHRAKGTASSGWNQDPPPVLPALVFKSEDFSQLTISHKVSMYSLVESKANQSTGRLPKRSAARVALNQPSSLKSKGLPEYSI